MCARRKPFSAKSACASGRNRYSRNASAAARVGPRILLLRRSTFLSTSATGVCTCNQDPPPRSRHIQSALLAGGVGHALLF